MAVNRTLSMRVNRMLGAGLVDANLITVENLEAANERLFELFNSGGTEHTSLLGVLTWELKVLREQDLLHYLIEEQGLGLIDLRVLDIPDDVKTMIDVDLCWATWAVPFDKIEDFTLLATAYYLSPATRSTWEKQINGRIMWYATSQETISETLERLEGEKTDAFQKTTGS